MAGMKDGCVSTVTGDGYRCSKGTYGCRVVEHSVPHPGPPPEIVWLAEPIRGFGYTEGPFPRFVEYVLVSEIKVR